MFSQLGYYPKCLRVHFQLDLVHYKFSDIQCELQTFVKCIGIMMEMLAFARTCLLLTGLDSLCHARHARCFRESLGSFSRSETHKPFTEKGHWKQPSLLTHTKI